MSTRWRMRFIALVTLEALRVRFIQVVLCSRSRLGGGYEELTESDEGWSFLGGMAYTPRAAGLACLRIGVASEGDPCDQQDRLRSGALVQSSRYGDLRD